MSKLSEKVAYLRGLTDGLNQDPASPQSKIIAEVIAALELATQKLDYVEEQVEDLSDYVDELDNDLHEVEEYLLEEADEECECDCGCDCDENCDENCTCSCHDNEYDEDFVAYQCPNCGAEVELDIDELDAEENPNCPACGAAVFSEE